MAASYWLDLQTTTTPEKIAEELWGFAIAAGRLGERIPGPEALLAGHTLPSGLWVRVMATEPDPDDIIADLGVRSTVFVSFRAPVETTDEQHDDLARLVGRVIGRVDGPAILTWKYGPTVWLLRTSDEVTVADEPGFWTPRRSGLLGVATRVVHQRLP